MHLALTKWELANLHLPPVTTVTLYSGIAPIQFLRDRIALILDKNPWLTSRIVKKSTADGVVAMAYDWELWEKAQVVLDSRYAHRNRKPKRDFAFTGLIRCGHCGCSMVAELKKSRYVYYHCSRAKEKCPEPYTQEEILEERFAELLERIRFDDEVLAWVSQALRVSHEDERQHHEDANRHDVRRQARWSDRQRFLRPQGDGVARRAAKVP
jgi:hypothetical protein